MSKGWLSSVLPLLVMCLLGGCELGGDGDDGAKTATATADRPVAYVSRMRPRDEDNQPEPLDLFDPLAFMPGATLYLRETASPNAREHRLLSGRFDGPVDIRDLAVSFDGRSLLFSLREPEIPNANNDEQPTWNIWEYRLDDGVARRVIANDLIAEEGQDRAPVYLPDGRILFSSTRQRQARARLIDEGRPQFAPLEESRRTQALALHVMNPDGSDIRQISFNPSHDLNATVDADGRLNILRWDNRENTDRFSFYEMNPDGTQVGLRYSRGIDEATSNYSNPLALPDGRLLVMERPNSSAFWSGVPMLIDPRNQVGPDTPLLPGMPTVPEQPLLRLPLAVEDGDFSRGGRVGAIAPLADGTGRFLVAWSSCLLRDGAALLPCTEGSPNNATVFEEPPAHGLWIFDLSADTQRLVRLSRPDRVISDVAVLAPRTLPTVRADAQPGVGLDGELFDESLGVLDIRSVFDVDGVFRPIGRLPAGVSGIEDYRDPAQVSAAQRSERFLRISKLVLIPGRELMVLSRNAFGRSPALGMREIVGYVPVEPDGSVRAMVPANVPLDIQLVNAAGMRIGDRHAGWLTVRPGEVRHCHGCHEADSGQPHGRPGAGPASINPGAPVTGAPFANTRETLFADAGETMAQVRARLFPDDQRPSVDLLFEDIWTNPDVREPDEPLSIRHEDLETPLPLEPGCDPHWTSLCRVVPQYQAHIQPIWDLPREADIDGQMVDVTCSACHTARDDMNQFQVPPAQLDLSGEPFGLQRAHSISYRQLLYPNNVQEVVDGVLVDAGVPLLDEMGNPVYEVDEEGELILDPQGEPIPVMDVTPLGQRMEAGHARASRFFNLFADGGSHHGWLSDAELFLLAAWLDNGGQFFNNPFDVPQ